MNIYEFPPIKLLVEGAYWLITRLSELLDPLTGAQSAAVAIVLLTLGVRALLIPVGRSQVKAARVRSKLAPKIAELRRRHKNQPELLQRKTMELYAAERASPFAGCLPVLAQIPVLMAVYALFTQATIAGGANTLLNHTLFGVPLDLSFAAQLTGGTLTVQGAVLGISILVLIGTVAWFSRKLLMPAPTTVQEQPPGMPDLSGMMRVLSFLPFLTVVFACVVPVAAALYLATTTTWTLGERLVLGKIYGTLTPRTSS